MRGVCVCVVGGGGGGVKGNKCRMTRSTFYVLKSTGRCFALLVDVSIGISGRTYYVKI